MKEKVHLIMPMGGAGSRFFKNGYVMPKPLIEIENKPFFYWATRSIEKFVDIYDLTFIVLQEHIDKFKIKDKILEFFPFAKIAVIPEILKGAVLTCMEGISQISDDMPIIFNDCDHAFYCKEFYEYCNSGNFNDIDGALLTFTSNDPKFSFLELDENQNVLRTIEKVAVSDKAICGAYYFRNVNIFKEAVNEYLRKCEYNEYFVSGVYNIMAEHGKVIKHFNVDSHMPFGTPDEYNEAKNSTYFEEFK